MDLGRDRLLVILAIIVHCCIVASDNELCRVEERINMGLSKINDPATILTVVYDYKTAPDCYSACCNYTGNQCNAVSYYDKETLCMMLNCRPFANCVWVTADGFTAARTKMTTVNNDALPAQMTSSATSQQQSISFTTSQGLTAEGATTPTTTTVHGTNSIIPGGLEPGITQSPIANTSSAPALVSPLLDGPSSLWNVDGGNNVPAENLPPSASEPSEQTTTAAIQGDDNQPSDQQPEQQQFDNIIDHHQSNDDWLSPDLDAPAPSGPDDGEPSLDQPVFIIPEEDPNARPREMKILFIQSPGIIIGMCSALGVAFLVLLAVCRKVYLSHDRPRYKPLRDYDIRFEPPAATSALLP